MGKSLPDLAEAIFQGFCAEADITANQSHKDRFGWDYLIEFDFDDDGDLSHDQKRGSATGRVQLKSKVGGKPAMRMKLSNALRFVKEPDPCFFVLVWQSKDGVETKHYARLVDDELMERILKRAREADRDGKNKLNRIFITIPLAAADESGADTGHWLKRQIAELPPDYSTKKTELAESIGYDANAMTANFVIDQRKIDDMIDTAVGLRESFEVENITMRKTRFDIPDRTPFMDEKPDKFTMVANPDPATLTLSNRGGRTVTFEGEYRAMWMPELPAEHWKATFKNKFVTVVISGKGSLSLNYKHNASVRLPIEELVRVNTFYLISASEAKLTVDAEGRTPLVIDSFRMEADVDWWYEWFEQVLAALSKLDIDLTLSLDELGVQYGLVNRLTQILSDGTMKLVGKLQTDYATAQSKIRNLLGYVTLEINGRLLGVITRRPCLKCDEEDGFLHIFFGKPIIIETIYSEAKRKAARKELITRFHNLLDQIGEGTLTVNDGDFSSDLGEDMEIRIY